MGQNEVKVKKEIKNITVQYFYVIYKSLCRDQHRTDGKGTRILPHICVCVYICVCVCIMI
jgi:hypothetical protein